MDVVDEIMRGMSEVVEFFGIRFWWDSCKVERFRRQRFRCDLLVINKDENYRKWFKYTSV